MKSLWLLLFTLFGGVFSGLFAQSDAISQALLEAPRAAVISTEVMFENAPQRALSVDVISKEEDLSKFWKGWSKKSFGTEGKKSGGFYIVKPAMRAAWSTDTMALYFKTEKDGDFSKLIILIQRKGHYVNATDDADILPAIKSDIESAINTNYLSVMDKQIVALQREYDTQLKDVERAKKQGVKLRGRISNEAKAADKAKAREEASVKSLAKSQDNLKSLQLEKEQQEKESAQMDKEILEQEGRVRTKQLEYDGYNKTGNLNSKKAIRAQKELDKVSALEAKQKAKRLKQTDAIAKTDRSIIQLEGAIRKAETTRDENMRSHEEHNRKRSNFEENLKGSDQAVKDEETEVNSARANLERMKEARVKMSGQ